MSKLYWKTCEIQPANTAFDDGSDTTFDGILTDGIEIVENEETANIEDNQDLNISYESGFTIQTRETTCQDGTTSILALTVNGGAYADIQLTAENGTTATLTDVYINGRKGIISSGEVGTKLNCKKSAATDPMTYA